MGFEPMPLFVQNVFYQLSYEAINSGTIKIIVHVAGHISKFYIPMKRWIAVLQLFLESLQIFSHSSYKFISCTYTQYNLAGKTLQQIWYVWNKQRNNWWHCICNKNKSFLLFC